MTLEQYNRLLTQPQNLTLDDLRGLDMVVDQYPFFQSAHALRLKILKSQESLGYNQALKKTAAITTDRDVLFEYITSAEFSQQTISETLVGHQDHVKQIEVTLEPQDKPQALSNQETVTDGVADSKNATHKHKSIGALDEKPFEFDSSERHSFEQWLKLTTAKPIDRSVAEEVNIKSDRPDPAQASPSMDKWDKIDRFLAQKTNIKPQNTDSGQDKAQAYLQTHEELMTETLARVYAQQKNYQKAIQAYKILILKYPEKSGFFADQIQELQRLLNA